MIYDIWEITDNNRCQISRLEAKDFDECIKMVLDYYVKPEFHESAYTDYADEGLTYVTIPDPDIEEDNEDFEPHDLTFELHVSDDQETRDFNLVTGHNEFITLDQGKPKTPLSQGKILDMVMELNKKLAE